METAITYASGNQPLITFSDDFGVEMAQIDKEFFVARAAQEFVMYRIYRIRKSEMWKDTYNTYQDFCQDIREKYGISYMTIHTRNTAYRLLEWIGYDANDAIKMMLEKPYLYSQVIQNLVTFNNDMEEPIIMANIDNERPKESLREIITDAGAMDSVREALTYVKENYTLKPTVSAYMSENNIVIEYTTYAINIAGEPEIDVNERITLYSDKPLPDVVYNAISAAIGRIGR